MLRIRQRGAFKPHGSAVSAIEMALWDVAGKSAGVPVYKLLGGKVRDQVRVYNGSLRFPLEGHRPEDYAEDVRRMTALPEGFTIIKQPISFHSPMKRAIPAYYYGEPELGHFHGALDRGPITEAGLAHTIDCVAAMKEVLGKTDRMFVAAAEMARPSLCGGRGGRRMGRHQASRKETSHATG
jgi:L-alanine-DL-glutamate epimerase-like enolase superfamily enzyme